jgi:molybdenum cofactor cytidylyltransferase
VQLKALARPPTVIVLASRRGERFTASGGQVHKLQALLNNKRVMDWTLDAVRASGLPFHVEDTGHPGMGDSIAAGVRATLRSASPPPNGWLILPADLPLIAPTTLLAVARALQAADKIIPAFNGQRGHPVGFSAKFASQLSNLQGNKGAAQINNAQAAIELIVYDVGCVMDIDTLEDLAKTQEYLRSS